MGGGSSIASIQGPSSGNPCDLFAFHVVQHEYEFIKVALAEEAPEAEEMRDETRLGQWLSLVYAKARDHLESSVSTCSFPAATAYIYSKLTDVDRKEFNDSVLEAIEYKEKLNRKQKASEKPADYSKSFGGTEADTKAEKEAAMLMRGGKEAEDESNPLLKAPAFSNKFEHYRLRKVGKWCKFMGLGCYMYMNTLSKEILSIRPDDYEEEQADNSSASAVIEKDPANGLPTIDLIDLPEEIDRIINECNETPLIIDTSAEQNVRTFFSFKGHLEDVSVLSIPFAKSGVKQKDVVERCRKRLVGAIKAGSTFALYLGNVSIENADWKTKLCKKDTFPSETFREAGKKLLPEKYKQIFREEDLEHGQAIARDNFRVVVVSSLDPYEYEAKLKDSIPLGYMKVIYVKS